jgi:hypothetical protein
LVHATPKAFGNYIQTMLSWWASDKLYCIICHWRRCILYRYRYCTNRVHIYNVCRIALIWNCVPVNWQYHTATIGMPMCNNESWLCVGPVGQVEVKRDGVGPGGGHAGGPRVCFPGTTCCPRWPPWSLSAPSASATTLCALPRTPATTRGLLATWFRVHRLSVPVQFVTHWHYTLCLVCDFDLTSTFKLYFTLKYIIWILNFCICIIFCTFFSLFIWHFLNFIFECPFLYMIV